MNKTRCLIGPHASIGKGVLNAIKYAEYIDGNTVQIFLGSNQTSSLKMKTKLNVDQITEIKNHIAKTKTVLVIHTIYLLNFCNNPPTSPAIKYAIDNLIYDIRLTHKLGGIGCVLHLGYKKDMNETEAYANMVANVKYAINQTNDCDSVKIILETPAGKGSQIGTTLSEFKQIWDAFPKSYHSRLGICVDTAHIFSSGSQISTVEGTKQYFKEFDKLIGLHYLNLFHINDSKSICNSRKDLHTGLGDGYIYGKGKDGDGDIMALKVVYDISNKYNIPMVLETHKGGYFNSETEGGKYQQEIALFRGWDNNKSIHTNFKLIHKPTQNKSPKLTQSTRNSTKKKSKKSSQPSSQTSSQPSSQTSSQPSSQPSNQNYKKHTINKRIVELFQELSYYYDLERDSIRKLSYDKGIYQLKRYGNVISSGNEVLHLPNIGKNMATKIDEIITTHELKTLTAFKNNNNNISLSSLKQNQDHKTKIANILGFGEKKAKEIKQKYNLNTVKELNYYLKNVENASNKLKLTHQQNLGLRYHKELSTKLPRDEAIELYLKIKDIISTSKNKDIKKCKVELAGSFASKYTTESKDIDILIIAPNSKEYKTKSNIENSDLLQHITELLIYNKLITHTISLGKTKFLGLTQLTPKYNHRHLDIRCVNKASYIYAKLYYTSGSVFNKMMRAKAKKNNMKLNEWGLYNTLTKEEIKNIKTERDIFKQINMDYIPLDDRR